MLGWHISVYRQADGGAEPAAQESPVGDRIAVWQTGIGGLDWLDSLVETGDVIQIQDPGYPGRYTAQAQHLLQRIKRPPGANKVWSSGPHDILTDKWEGKTVCDKSVAEACSPDEWLIVEAWDES